MDGDRFFLLGHLVAKREDGKAMTLSPLQRARDMAHFRISASDTVLYMNFESAATCWPCHFGLGCIIAYCFSSYIIVKYPASRLGLLPCQIPILLQIVSLFFIHRFEIPRGDPAMSKRVFQFLAHTCVRLTSNEG